MMRLLFLFSIVTIISCTGKLCDKANLQQKFLSKNQALVDENTSALDRIAMPNLNYVHSNGWCENKASFLQSSQQKSLQYKSIVADSVNYIVEGNTGLVSGLGIFNILYKKSELNLNLFFSETYVCKNGEWKLLGRHACKK